MLEKSTAFAVIGDRYHNSDYIRTALGKTLVQDLGLTIDFTDDVKLLNAETLDGYKMLITFRDGMIWPDWLRCGRIATTKRERTTGTRGRGDRCRLDHRTTGAGGQRFRRRRWCRAVLSQFDLHRQGQCDLSRSVRGSNRRASAGSTVQSHAH